jgi:hypothetical protein
MRIVLSCVLVTAFAGPAAAQAVWTGPSGGGMLAVQEAAVLEPGHFSFGLVTDNYDRDPLGLDAFDIRFDWRLAVAPRWEVYGRYQVSRGVSTPGFDPVPSPPLDVVSFSGSGAVRAPYRALYWPMPYLKHHGSRLSEMVPGEYTAGLKRQLTAQRGRRPALSASAEIIAPGDLATYPLEKGSGSGSTDWKLSAAATWRYDRYSLSVNAAYTSNRNLSRADRLIVATGLGGTEVTDEPIRRPGFLHGGIGLRAAIRRGVSAFAEFYGWDPVGGHTQTFGSAGASDVLAGIQLAVKGICLTAGYRQHLDPPQNGEALATGPLGGALDLSALSPPARWQYLRSVGIDPRAHLTGSGLVVVGETGMADPKGSVRIPDTYLTHTTGNGGFVTAVSLSF